MKTNKEVIDALQGYFLQQDPKIVARTLAALMIDMNRVSRMDYLKPMEKECLLARMIHNNNELLDFINGKREPMRYSNIESE